MEFIRVFTNPDRCMQRLGFLKHLVWKASQAATNNLSTLGKELITAVSQKISVNLTSELQEYIKNALTDSAYKDLRTTTYKPLNEGFNTPTVKVEIQDFYLSGLGIFSRRGKLVKEDWRKYLYLALDLGLLRKGTYSLLVRGQSFLSLVSDSERKAFGKSELIPLNGDSNPFRLIMPQRLLLLFSFIERDGDVLSRLYGRLLSLSESFTDRDAGCYFPEIYRSIVKESRGKTRSGDDLLRIQRLLDTAEKIQGLEGKSYTGGSAITQHSRIRLEPFVDLGLLSKPDPFAYRYQITDATKTFFEPLINSESIDYFLQNSFFNSTNKALVLNGEHRIDRETMLSTIQKAYVVLKSPLGYTPILEMCLLAAIYSITEKGVYFEISEAIETLKSLQPELVRFNVDRWGKLTFVKFNDDIYKSIDG